jgi:hypothetical protein
VDLAAKYCPYHHPAFSSTRVFIQRSFTSQLRSNPIACGTETGFELIVQRLNNSNIDGKKAF